LEPARYFSNRLFGQGNHAGRLGRARAPIQPEQYQTIVRASPSQGKERTRNDSMTARGSISRILHLSSSQGASAMPYTVWSQGVLVGHTELDIPCVQSAIRQGFIAPTDEGRRLLAIAAGVPAACARLNRATRRSGGRHRVVEKNAFRLACDRREALNLEMRDEDGVPVSMKFIRVHDIQSDPFEDADARDDELVGPEGQMDEHRAELEAEIADVVSELASSVEGEEWKEELDPDPRWETTQYCCMIFLGDADDAD
jgi:hypothetical protein